MNRQISLSQYRSIDLAILAVLMVLSQALISVASTTIYADQLYVVSTVGAVTALVMMRWNGWAAIHAVLGGITVTALAGGNGQQYLIYCAGNLLSLAALPLFKHPGKERIRQDGLAAMLFALCVQVLMQLGRGAAALLLGYPVSSCVGFITTDALSILFTMCVIWVCRRIEGLFEDQKKYLLRIHKGQSVEGREQI